MGLDQYAYTADGLKVDENGHADVINSEEIAYWRKHNRLQGWMEQLWNDKGRPHATHEEGANPFGTSFNCVPVELTLTDLEQLEAHIVQRTLPSTQGFFFGDDSYEEYEEHYKEQDLEFIENARKAIEDGKKVYYNCWW